ncbi:PEP-CTERM sorting domain-containing protein [Paucibacter sp. M5-1]|uniref:PEP-CTERM sorting domain-containing protein n=1 Tax=Paucibacter sp. M5-1 TaxID=3015998 RepID=UPI0022B87207|nr:PEP-CTERM sorting domain-containing protein [Paucibacter sp. M5-1]MCZ7884276.1 PEP-CTERM sorting domain-containing protein [Paucibacter sp. M5-1]
MKPSLSKPLLSLGLVVLAGQAAAQQQVLSVGQAPGTPGYTYTYGGLPYSSSTRYNPQPGKVLQMSWTKDATNTTGLVSAELGRLRVAEFGSGRAYATDGSLFGIGGNLRQASFEDTLSLEGAGLNANTVMRIDYHFGGRAGGRIETNTEYGNRLDILAELAMVVGPHGLLVTERTWATQDVLAGGQTRSTLASSGIFDVSATGFSMRLGPKPQFGNYQFDVEWRLALRSQCLFTLSALPPNLPAPSGGCSYSADYGNTASFMGLSLYDGVSGALLDPASYYLRSGSGFDYGEGFGNTAPVPEPQSWALLALGLTLLGWRRARQAAG